MLEAIRDFFNKHIRFKREEDADVEEIWDLMICGQAHSLKAEQHNNVFINFLMKIAGMIVMVFGAAIFGFCDGTPNLPEGVSAAAVATACGLTMFFFPIIYYTILQYTVEKLWLKLVLYFGVIFVIGLIIGVIC